MTTNECAKDSRCVSRFIEFEQCALLTYTSVGEISPSTISNWLFFYQQDASDSVKFAHISSSRS